MMDEAVGIVASAKRPIVLAGQGAASTDARAALLRLASRTGAPVATTLRARDLFHGEPYNLGIFGTLSDETALDIITQSDVVIAFGASLNNWTTAEGSILQNKKVVHVDTDHAALAQHSSVHVGWWVTSSRWRIPWSPGSRGIGETDRIHLAQGRRPVGRTDRG